MWFRHKRIFNFFPSSFERPYVSNKMENNRLMKHKVNSHKPKKISLLQFQMLQGKTVKSSSLNFFCC